MQLLLIQSARNMLRIQGRLGFSVLQCGTKVWQVPSENSEISKPNSSHQTGADQRRADDSEARDYSSTGWMPEKPLSWVEGQVSVQREMEGCRQCLSTRKCNLMRTQILSQLSQEMS